MSLGSAAATKAATKIVLRVAIGSSNPIKVKAAELAIRQVLDDQKSILGGSSSKEAVCADEYNSERIINASNVEIDLQSFDVDSCVRAQPFDNEETRAGAKNRAKRAYHAFRQANENENPHFALGIEGGVEWGDNTKELYCMAWMAAYGKRLGDDDAYRSLQNVDTQQDNYSETTQAMLGLAKSAMFHVPIPVADLVRKGVELGAADDTVFHREKSGQGSGTIGIVSGGLINRTEYYVSPLIMALSPWIRPDLYPRGNSNART